MGRHKKRGPKKKKKVAQHVYVGLPRPYHIICTSNGVQIDDLYSAVSIEKIYEKFHKLVEEKNSNVEFPVRFISSHKDKHFVEADYKLFIIKKKQDEEEVISLMRDEYGKIVDCETNNDKWSVIDSADIMVEETFWVYGYNPKVDRKTFQFIFDNILSYTINNKYSIREVVVFKNKLLINSLSKLDMVICKNHQDSVRLFNTIRQKIEGKRKYRFIVLGGDISSGTRAFQMWLEKIKELTHWDNKKILRNTTRP